MTTRRRFGRLRKLPSGRWQARYPGPDGRDRTASATFATKTDGARYLASVEVDQARGVWLDPNRSGVNFREYAEEWLKTRRVRGEPLAASTQSTYRHRLDHLILPTFADTPIDKISSAQIRAWHAETTKVGATSAAQAYRLLHGILATAFADDDLRKNPCQVRGAGNPHAAERPLVIREDVERLAAAMPEHLQAFILLAFWAGLRLGELLALEIGDFMLDEETNTGRVRIERQQQDINRVTTISKPKVGSIRTVHLPTAAVATMIAHLATRPAEPRTTRVFVKPGADFMRCFDVYGPWKRARKTQGLDNLRIHDLRHAGLTLAAQSGGTLKEVMRRAGHTTSRAALIYQHAADDRDRDLAARMG